MVVLVHFFPPFPNFVIWPICCSISHYVKEISSKYLYSPNYFVSKMLDRNYVFLTIRFLSDS